MDWTNLIGNVAGGGLLGLVGSLATSWINLKAKREENRHAVQMLKLRADVATIEGEAAAFTESQRSGQADVIDAPKGATGALLWMSVGTQCLRTATRPLLTWALVGCAFWRPEMSAMAAMAVGWWFGSRPAAFFTGPVRQ